MSGKRVALIVANFDYTDPFLPPLQKPELDAEALRRVLADPEIGGYDVEPICMNEPKHKLEERLEDFFSDRAPDDLLLLHFACHGVKDDDGSFYFATPDTRWLRFDSTAVSGEWVRRQMEKSRSRRIALLLDCCYSGLFPAGEATRAATAAPSADIKERFGGDAHAVLTASTSVQYSYEGTELKAKTEPSFFTSALVRGLESGAGATGDWISIEDLFEYVSRDVRERNPKQTPQRFISGERLLIARSPRPGVSRTVAERQGRARPRDYSRLVPHIRLKGAGDELYSVAISSTGRAVAAGTDSAVFLWRADEDIRFWKRPPKRERLEVRASTEPLHTSYVYAVAFSPDGDAVASCDEDGVVRVTGLDGRELLHKTKAARDGHDEAVYSLAFSPDGKYLASGSWDRSVIVWNLERGMVHRKHAFAGRISSVDFPTESSNNLLGIGSLDNSVVLWDVDRGRPAALEGGHVSSVEAVAFSFDGSRLASCGLDKTVRMWDVAQRKPAWDEAEPEHEYLVRSVAFAPGGATLVSASWDKAMKLWDVATGAVSELPSFADWEHTDWIWSVTFSPDGRLLASAGSDSTILVWSLPDDA